MRPRAEALNGLAALLRYPDERYHETARACRAALEEAGWADASALAGQFAEGIEGWSRETLQERYTATLDLDPACSLEIGWHLFGENYDRGAFLVEMRDRLRAVGIRERVELPDHLTHVLPLLARLDEGAAAALAGASVAPAMEKIVAALERGDTPFVQLLRAVGTVVSHVAGREALGVGHD